MTTDNILILTGSGDVQAPSNVVSLADSAQTAATGRFPACRDLHAYWDALRGSRIMPARSEFNPRGIEQTLAGTFIAEKVAPRVARIRVSGSIMNDILGMDVRGMPITSFFDPDSREALADAMQEVFANPAMVVLELTARVGMARKVVHARMLLLPMSDTEGQVSRIVGCLDLPKGLSRTPRRFEITSIRSSNLTGDPIRASLPQEQEFKAPAPAPSYAFAETPSEFRSSRRPEQTQEKPKGLRLVVCND